MTSTKNDQVLKILKTIESSLKNKKNPQSGDKFQDPNPTTLLCGRHKCKVPILYNTKEKCL